MIYKVCNSPKYFYLNAISMELI